MASSPVRRVLGSKDANASLNIRSPNKQAELGVVTGDNDTAVGHLKSPVSKTKLSQTLQAGQKRKFEDVEEIASEHSRKQFFNTNDLGSELNSSSPKSSGGQLSVTDTTGMSFATSQAVEQPLEPQFELPQEEMSQRTLENLHAVPMPQDDAHSTSNIRPKLHQEISLGSAGMSSFINFEDSASSQNSDVLHPVSASAKVHHNRSNLTEAQSALDHIEEQERKRMLEEKASQLRTRLQLAMFKVQSNQTSRPFRQLKRAASIREKSSSPPPFVQRQSSNHRLRQQSLQKLTSPKSQGLSHHSLSPESRIAAFRAQAAAQKKPAISSLESLPVPRIQPTTFSARYTQTSSTHHAAANKDMQDDKMDDVQLPSSPPLSRITSSSENHTQPLVENSNNAQKTPKTPAVMQSVAEMQLSSPPASEVDQEELGHDEQTTPRAEEAQNSRKGEIKSLTSSVVKGEAADGLLKLMRGGKSLPEV